MYDYKLELQMLVRQYFLSISIFLGLSDFFVKEV